MPRFLSRELEKSKVVESQRDRADRRGDVRKRGRGARRTCAVEVRAHTSAVRVVNVCVDVTCGRRRRKA